MKSFIINLLFSVLTLIILVYNPFTVRTMAIGVAHAYHLDTHFFYKLIKQESTFRSLAISRQKALGPGQVREGTARYLDSKYQKGMLYFPYYNLRISAQYIQYLLNKYNHNWSLTIAAYNWGETNVDKKISTIDVQPDADYRELFENVRETYNLLNHVLGDKK
jgi:soluble lytic murein transglycosylase-like protein